MLCQVSVSLTQHMQQGFIYTGASQKNWILWKSSFMFVTYLKKWNFHIFLIHYMQSITFKKKKIYIYILMIRAYSSWKSKIQYLKILEYLHLSFIKWPSLQYKFWVSLVLWNHNNGEDCWLGNDPEDEHWHPPQKRVSHRGSLLKGVAVYRVLYQSILNAKLTGRKQLGRKRCSSNRDDCKLENTVKQSWKLTWESFTRSGLKLESVHQESPRSDVFRAHNILTFWDTPVYTVYIYCIYIYIYIYIYVKEIE